ncbi:3-oxoacyl-ACP reductase [Pseudonocardia halophobica]|uniref:3-oxoacyl-ACP reductase n=1 Tax=Pseudonocardia halophobica TaxID=29401 RepID=A0A9W6L2U3_9PSEU|nr:3-oxoacyl-ACP reductase [Pseudonocardia halophobica]GLL11865.1 3-oxoacyl-ACP reductase [Pseudonocardia halophobica]
MSTDRFRDLSNTALAGRLGVPRVPLLRRYEPGQALLPGPALVTSVGAGRFAKPIAALVEESGQHVVDEVGDQKLAAVVVDLTAAVALDDLAAARAILTPAVRKLAPSGRLLLLGPEPAEASARSGVEAAATAQALDGLVRTIAKELRAGATANLLVVAADAPPAAVDSSVRFFLSARSAYVDGQVVRVGVPVGSPRDPAAMDSPTAPEKPLAGRVAVVTGAARGIGAAIADTLARDGATLVVVDVPAAGENLAKVANRTGGTALQLDITAVDAPERLVAHLTQRHGRVDLLVHNAGITRDKLLANMDPDRWNAVLNVNLRAQLRITEALLADGTLLQDGSRIVCVSSQSGIGGNRGQANYVASKAGIIGMVRALAPVVAERGVTINAVAPGFIETEMTARMPVGTREAGRRVNSLRQGGLPVDVAETIGWLGQAESGGVNGHVVRVCGQSMLGA